MSHAQISNQQHLHRTQVQVSAISNRLGAMVAVLLIATAFRFFAIDSAPPGWRDDELIEFNMDRRIADGWRPLFITEAEGHEPVYHYLHAGTLLLYGDNIVGYKWLPMAFGLLTIALTYALARKMFGDRVALLAAVLMAVSFWPIMYSRFGVRHIGLLPWMLAAMYILYPSPQPSPLQGEGVRLPRPLKERIRGEGRILMAGVCLAAGMMTYFAGRAVPIILAGFLAYLLLFQRSILKRVWWRYAVAIAIGAVLTVPMFVEIANTPGGEKRTEVVGGPLIELRNGNVQPAIETTLGTLGMFTFAGDPESLYNVSNRPVFDWITGAFFYLGVLICLLRLKRTESGFALAWLMIGIAPAFVSVPAASFSHTIAALPVVYVLVAVGIGGIVDKYASRQGNKVNALSTYLLVSLSTLLIGLNGWLTIRDYLGTWANDWLVQFQYHAPTREIARWLDQTPQVNDIAIGTHATQLTLDPLALNLDLTRNDMQVRWFNPERALVIPRWFNHDRPVVTPATGTIILSSLQAPGDDVKGLLSTHAGLIVQQPDFAAYAYQLSDSAPIPPGRTFGESVTLWAFHDSLTSRPHPGEIYTWLTDWKIDAVDNRLRLKLFFHLLADTGEVIAGDDREDVNWATLHAGDRLLQLNQLSIPAGLAPGNYPVEVGWYDPETGERLIRADGSSHYLIDVVEIRAP